MEKKKALKFLHITKTAGSSIEELGQRVKLGEPLKWGKYDDGIRDAASSVPPSSCMKDFGANMRSAFKPFWHIPPKYWSDSRITKQLIKNFDYFMVVRNPYDRVVSEYWCEWGGPKQKHKTKVEANKWIKERLLCLKRSMKNESLKFPVHGHWTPQYLYLEPLVVKHWQGDNVNLTVVPKKNVIRLENIAQDFDILMSEYRLKGRILPWQENKHENKGRQNNSTGLSFTKYDLDDQNIELVKDIYAKDFDTFNYDLKMAIISTDKIHSRDIENTLEENISKRRKIENNVVEN